jgi:hypothetical protein
MMPLLSRLAATTSLLYCREMDLASKEGGEAQHHKRASYHRTKPFTFDTPQRLAIQLDHPRVAWSSFSRATIVWTTSSQ